MTTPLQFRMLFTGDASQLVAETQEARKSVSSVSDAAESSAVALNADAAAMDRDAQATRRLTEAKIALARAEKDARERFINASGMMLSPRPVLPSGPAQPNQPPPPETPANDNERRDRARRQVLGYQAFDIGQGLFGGMPISMIAAQQGPQIAQLYAGQGGINTALKDFRTIAGSAARAITPLTAGIAGLTAVVATGAIAYNGYLQSTKEVETAAAGLGRGVAGSKSEMEEAARAGASAAGISISSARSMEAQFLRTGRIGSENFEGLIAISKDFGATMGVTSAEAGAMLAEMFADPAKAADTLYQKYGLIDAATARQATNLAAQNRQSEAQAVLLKALPSQLADASEATTALGRAWDAVAKGASEAFDWMGRAVDRSISGPTLEEQLATARQARDRLATPSGMLDFLNPGKAQAIADAARLPELEERKRRQDEEAAAQAKRNADIARSRAASTLYEASPANARSMQEQRLRNEIEALKSARGAQGIDAGQNENAIEAKTRALDALINRQERSAELDRLDIQITNERNPLLRAELEARRTRLQMTEQEISADTLAAETARARNRVIEQTIAAASSQASDMRSEVEARVRLNSLVASGAITSADANRMLQEEATLRPLIAAAGVADIQTKDRLNKTIAELTDGYAALAAEEKRASFIGLMRGQNDNIERLRLEQTLIGQSANVRARAIALLEAEQRIRDMGYSANSREAAQLKEKALQQARITSELERQEQAWSRVQQAGSNTIDSLVDGLTSGDIGGAFETIAKDFTSMMSELAIKNPLKNSLLGTNLGTIFDLGGGLGSTDSMSVGADTVCIDFSMGEIA